MSMAWSLWTNTFGFGKGVFYSDEINGLDWWEEIDESEEWQTGIFLSASYALISFVALVQLCRIQMRVPKFGWTTQKLFHLMNFIVNGLRAVLFGLYKSAFLIRPRARSLPIDKLRPTYFTVNSVIYITQACIWILMRLSKSPVAVEVGKLFFARAVPIVL